MRAVLLSFIAGSSWVQTLAGLPSLALLAGLALAAVLAGAATRAPVCRSRRYLGLFCLCLASAIIGFCQSALRAQWRSDDALAPVNENVVTPLRVRIVSLPSGDHALRSFDVVPLPGRISGVPSRIRVRWFAPRKGGYLPVVKPGQVWRMALGLQRPYSRLNPDAPDGEGRLFAVGIRALATVRGVPRLLADEPYGDIMSAIQRVRFVLRERMRTVLRHRRHAAVVIALALGDQSGIARADWQRFGRTGITHLVAISGLHVTLAAGLVGMLAGGSWRRVAWRGVALAERVPAQIVAALCALLAAWAYCLLAGWGIPARRTCLMLSIVALAAIARLPLKGSRVLIIAGAGVIALDPWAVMSLGFWLSFAAVAVLGLAVDRGRQLTPPCATQNAWQAWGRRCWQGVRVQLIMTLALMPPLAFAVQQVSLASPLANALAIPVVSTLVTPLALLCALACAIPGAGLLATWAGVAAEGLFRAIMVPIGWLADQQWAGIAVGAAPLGWLLLALAGVAWAIQAPGLPCRRLAWLLMVPMLFWRPSRPDVGDWRLTALDVGQGGAIVVETAAHVLVFDTGPRYSDQSDAGENTVWPFLRARAVHRVDTLVVSHVHLDHVGGVRGLLAHLPVRESFASFDLPAYLRRERRLLGIDISSHSLQSLPRGSSHTKAPIDSVVSIASIGLARRCVAGMTWRVDGVRFSFMHPADAAVAFPDDPNAESCVLLVQGIRHGFILTGDIGRRQESAMLDRVPGVDIVLAGHHGSATSSSVAWIAATRANHVIAQAGFANQFGHPAAAVQRRWVDAGAAFWRTDLDGAVMAQSSGGQLTVWAQRDVARRYWHRPIDN